MERADRRPMWVYFGFVAVILGAVAMLKPGFSFMEDFGMSGTAARFWSHPGKLRALGEMIDANVHYGRFRPFYYVWAMTFYGLFHAHPVLFNAYLSCLNLGFMLIWGRIFQIAYGDDDPRLLWVYPLAFFIFTPFWNLFMWICLQERYFLVWGALALLLYLHGKRANSALSVFFSGLFFLLVILGKETGIGLFAAVGLFSLIDLLAGSREKRLNGAFFASCAVFGLPYSWFLKTRVIGHGYSEGYTADAARSGALSKLLHAPLVPGLLLLVAALAVAFFVYDRFFSKGRRIDAPQWLIFPLALGVYLGLILPWGFPTYMLAPAAIFLFGTLYAGVRMMGARGRRVVYGVLVPLSLFMVVFNSVPSISAIADQRKVTDFARENLTAADTVVFFPAPYTESAESLAGFSGANVVFAGTDVKPEKLDFTKKNVIVMHLECSPVRVPNARLGDEIYRNDTWSISRLEPDAGHDVVVSPQFRVNFLKSLKVRLRKL